MTFFEASSSTCPWRIGNLSLNLAFSVCLGKDCGYFVAQASVEGHIPPQTYIVLSICAEERLARPKQFFNLLNRANSSGEVPIANGSLRRHVWAEQSCSYRIPTSWEILKCPLFCLDQMIFFGEICCEAQLSLIVRTKRSAYAFRFGDLGGNLIGSMPETEIMLRNSFVYSGSRSWMR